MFMEDLPKKGSLFRECWPKNSPIWEAHTCTLNVLCTPLDTAFANSFPERFLDDKEVDLPSKVPKNSFDESLFSLPQLFHFHFFHFQFIREGDPSTIWLIYKGPSI